MLSVLVPVVIVALLALWLVWALACIRRRKRSGKGCGSCSASCPYHDHCKS